MRIRYPCSNFLFRKWGFILAADICTTWGNFGGIPGKINNIGIITYMAIAENPFVDMKYDEALIDKPIHF